MGLYGATIALGAFLLFWIQPLFAKQALPLLGGSPGVWNVALVFFQTALLAGYLYAHLISGMLTVRTQVVGHLVLAGITLLVLPVGIPEGWIPDAGTRPATWILALFAVAIGMPFFVVSATSPLLQRWFARAGLPSSDDPYFLYSASNLGSLGALLAFPLLLEPRIGLLRQGVLWAWGFGALMALLLASGLVLLRRQLVQNREERAPIPERSGQPRAPRPSEREAGRPIGAEDGWNDVPSAEDRLWWTALALAPASLLLGVTTHITTDVAAVPLLWIVPLSLYLLSFAIVFARRPLLPHRWMLWAQPYAVVLLVLAILFQLIWSTNVAIQLIGFFLIAMVCHGELVRRRPPARYLTEFYLWMAIGGVLGGAFNALAAPELFDSVLEYPLMIALACALRPVLDGSGRRWKPADLLASGLLAVGALLAGWVAIAFLEDPPRPLYVAVLLVASLVAFSFRRRPVRFALGIGALFVAFPLTFGAGEGEVIARERSFFGVHTVRTDEDGTHRLLWHGTTLHGAQPTEPARRDEPLTYYSRHSPVADVLNSVQGSDRSVGVVGLGTGSLACHRRPDDEWTFFEIDPTVVQIATGTEHFDFLARCAPDARIVLGDARLSLRDGTHGPLNPGTRYDVLVLDAFSSDAIPVHLLTVEAIRLYLTRLREGGVLAFHISNRHLRLWPVLGAAAEELGLAGRQRFHRPEPDSPRHVSSSHWVVVARNEAVLRDRLPIEEWRPLRSEGLRPWTDDFSNILSVLQ